MRTLYRYIFDKLLNIIFTNDPRRIGQLSLGGNFQLVWLSERVGRKIALRMFERKETRFFGRIIQKGDVCLDIGANIGYFTHLFASRVGNFGRVVAIEPVRRNALLIELASLLNETDTIVRVVNAAVSNNNGLISLDTTPDSSYANVSVNQDSNKNGLRAITVDSCCAELQLSKIDIIKMDIEGWEYQALQGMKGLLSDQSRQPRIMMIELVSSHLARYGSSIEQICDFLAGFGYVPHVLDRRINLVRYMPYHHNIIENVFFISNNNGITI
jgi:FkbM family methyltransferase